MGNTEWSEVLRALYPVWAFVGALVVLNYGDKAREQWRVEGKTWWSAPREWAAIVWFVIEGCARDVWSLIVRQTLPDEPAVFSRFGYSPGHLLRFFIMVSFLTCTLFGINAYRSDRHTWPIWQLAFTAFGISLSIVAGLGHLFVAWRFHARRWRWLVAAGFIFAGVSWYVDHVWL